MHIGETSSESQLRRPSIVARPEDELSMASNDGHAERIASAEAMTDADAQYLAQVWRDCETRLAPGSELLELHRESADEGVSLVARYRLGRHNRESAATGDTLLEAHSALRDRIIIDRIRFGFSDIVESR